MVDTPLVKNAKLESAIVRDIMTYLKTRPNSFTVKTHGSVYQNSGVPDVYHLEQGVSFWIEVKRPKLGRLTELQKATIDRLNAAGACAFVARSVDEVRHVIEFRFSR